MPASKLTIAIDGPAASGKGTLARKLAEIFNLAHMDTGALYRAVGLEVLDAGGDPDNEEHASAAAQRLMEKIQAAGSPSEILSNPDLRRNDVGQAASKVAAHPAVRETLLALQRDFAQNPGEGYDGAVLDGRDIGTVVCPDAPIKLFVTASLEARAARRTKELQSKGFSVNDATVLDDMRERDARDSSRSSAPLITAEDAVTLDTSDLSEDEVLQKVIKIIRDQGFEAP